MKTEREGRTIEAGRGATRGRGKWGQAIGIPNDHISLDVENLGDPQESVEAQLTPAEARQLAAELVRLADAIEQE